MEFKEMKGKASPLAGGGGALRTRVFSGANRVCFVGYTRPAHKLPDPHTDAPQRARCQGKTGGLFAVDDDGGLCLLLLVGRAGKLARQANALFDTADVGIADERIDLSATLRTRSVFRHFALLGQFYCVVLCGENATLVGWRRCGY
jgi:hypothetical protein